MKYLDDRNYAQSYVRFRSMKGYGPLKIADELKKRGIATDSIKSILSKYDWSMQLTQLIDKNSTYRQLLNPKENNRQKRIKIVRSILNKGHRLSDFYDLDLIKDLRI